MLVQNDRYVTHRQHCILVDGASHRQYTIVTNSVHTFTGDYPVVLKRKYAYRNSLHSTNEIPRLAWINSVSDSDKEKLFSRLRLTFHHKVTSPWEYIQILFWYWSCFGDWYPVEVCRTDVSEKHDAAIFRVWVNGVRIPKLSFRFLGGRQELKSGLEQQDRCTGNCENTERQSSRPQECWVSVMQCNVISRPFLRSTRILK